MDDQARLDKFRKRRDDENLTKAFAIVLNSKDNLDIYDFDENKLHKGWESNGFPHQIIPKIPVEHLSTKAIIHNNAFYIVTPNKDSRESQVIFRNKLGEDEWIQLAEMPELSNYPSVGVLEYKLIVKNMNTAYAMNLLPNEECLPIKLPDPDSKVASATAITMEFEGVNNIVMIGGRKLGQIHTDTVERFNFVDNKWIAMASMNQRQYAVSAAVLNNKIYVFGGHFVTCCPKRTGYHSKNMEVYDPISDQWTILDQVEFPVSYCNICCFRNEIYAHVQDDGFKMIKWNKENNKWEIIYDLMDAYGSGFHILSK